MRLNTWIPLGLALVLGLAAAIVAKGMMGKGKTQTGPAQIRVVSAKENVPPGRMLTGDDLVLTTVTGTERPVGSFDQVGAIAGRVLTTQLVKGQVVLDTFLAAPGAQAGVQSLVPDGLRLITIEVNEFSSLAGMLAPGCRVDILAALSDPETKEMMARTVVENVKIQAVGQRLGTASAAPQQNGAQTPEEAAGFRSVTLLVSPAEAEAIHVASTAGRPWLVLRPQGDNALNKGPGISLADIRGHAKAEKGVEPQTVGTTKMTSLAAGKPATQPTADATKKGRTLTFIRGGKIEVVTLEEPGASVATTQPSSTPAATPAPQTVTNVETAPAIKD